MDSRQGCCHNRTVLEKILAFGRDLQNMSVQLRREHGKNETNKKALRVCTKVIVFLGKYHENNDSKSYICHFFWITGKQEKRALYFH